VGIVGRLRSVLCKCVVVKGALAFLSLWVCLAGAAKAVDAQEKGKGQQTLSLRFENDSFGETDENYTNGISLALTNHEEGPMGRVWGLFGEPGGERYATYELTQLQFTPSDLRRSDPDPLDRPYAGVLYMGLATHLQREDSLHSLKLMAGVVGPASFSEDLQKITHHAFVYSLPQGWDHQIKNEPILNLLYEYRHNFILTRPEAAVGVQVIPMGGLFLGNYLTQAELSLQTRMGYHLPADFGTTVLRGMGYLPFPEQERMRHSWGAYVFAGGSANLVGRNITLDGNTVAQSRSVSKRLFLPTAEFGAALWTQGFQTTFSYVMMGREFSGQPQREDYGSVLVSFFF
jgi:lipid A 3-O-deacylase